MHLNQLDGYCFFGSEVLLSRLMAMQAEIQGVRQNEDIEYIHRMRVASRRIRAALRIFETGFDPKPFRRWKRGIRDITRGLGAARDADVQIEFLEKFCENIQEQPAHVGIERMILRLKQLRAGLQSDVLKALKKIEYRGTVPSMAEKLRERIVLGRIQHIDPKTNTTFKRASLAISIRLEEMLTYEPYIHQQERRAEHHQMRIAAKGLRYTLEIFDPLYNGKLKPFIKHVKRIQSILGDQQDCEVWMSRIPVFLEEEQVRTLAYFGHMRPMKEISQGIHFLRANREEEHAKLFTKFGIYWKELRQAQRWKALTKLLEIHGTEPTKDTNHNQNATQPEQAPADAPSTPPSNQPGT